MSQSRRMVAVTGAGTGIGKAIAARFLTDGDVVAIAGRREEVLRATADELRRNTSGGEVHRHVCDVGDADQVDAFAVWLGNECGETVDVLVNNAGGVLQVSDEASTAEMARYAYGTLSGNLIGTFLMVHALGPRLRRPGGRIVNLSSIAAFRGGGDIYSAAKAGVVG